MAAKESAGDAYVSALEDSVAALRQLIVTLTGAPGVSPYTQDALAAGQGALAALDALNGPGAATSD